MKKSFIALVAVLTSCGAFAAENLALNKTYTMSRKPNYKLTTNDTDNIELTDGKFSRGSRIWTSENTTVGWAGSQQVTITIDLGSEQPICGAMWSTAGGHAGVKWPDFINVFVNTIPFPKIRFQCSYSRLCCTTVNAFAFGTI